MKKTFKKITFATLLGFATLTSYSAFGLAEDRYVTDTIYIPLRADKDNQAPIVKSGVVTGTRLKLIREEEDANKNKWSQVITPEGQEGWVRSQNLIAEPTAAMKLEAMSSAPSDVVELQKQNASLKTELAALKGTYDALVKQTEEMRTATNSDINMEQENQNMHREYQLLQTERDVLKAQNDQLKTTDRFKQNIYGGGLILCGVILSFLLQMVGKRKRRSEWH